LDYPPVLLFSTYPLGFLSYLSAFAVWNAVGLAVYLTAIYLILPRWIAIVLALTPFAVPADIVLGNNGLLTAGLIGLSLVFLERRPWFGGALLGLLTYKPQFGLLFPLALLASRNWRGVGAAAASSVALGIAAGVAFGFRGWPLFLESLLGRSASFSPGAGVELRLQSVYGLMRWLGTGGVGAWALHIAAAVIVAVAVWAVWAGPTRYSLKAALLCIGSATVTPYLIAYDLCVLSIAVAFFVGDGLTSGFLPGERATLLLCWVGLLLLPVFPIGSVICVALFLLTGRRIIGHPVVGAAA
jgi:hypothetical protein